MLADSGLDRGDIDLLALGNTANPGNPARLIALTGGLGEQVPTVSVDRQDCSGLEAIMAACRAIETGDAQAVVAGGAEALSMAPWLIAKPRGLHQTPRFIAHNHDETANDANNPNADAANALASLHSLDRAALDKLAFQSHERATEAQDKRRLTGEIVALRAKTTETSDELVDGSDLDDIAALPLITGDGTATSGNLSAPADGAAFVIAVSDVLYARLGKPPALRITARASIGRPTAAGEPASVAVARRLAERHGFGDLSGIDRIELGEASAAEALVFQHMHAIAASTLNPDGGQVARGLPPGAAGAILLSPPVHDPGAPSRIPGPAYQRPRRDRRQRRTGSSSVGRKRIGLGAHCRPPAAPNDATSNTPT